MTEIVMAPPSAVVVTVLRRRADPVDTLVLAKK
jgi:hypothetical protein